MKSLKFFAIWSACLSLVFTTTVSQAALDVNVRRAISYLNYESNLEAMITKYKGHFTTKADHRFLDNFAKQNQKTADKWLWRFEARSQDQVALRINGRVQAIISEINPLGRTFKVNGTPIAWTEGQSFENYYNGIVEALNKKTAQHPFEALFIQEAHAFLPLLAVGALLVGGIAIASAEQANAHQPQCQYTPVGITARSSSGDRTVVANQLEPYRSNFRGGRLCHQEMKRDFRQRMEQVRPNFRDNGMFNTRTNTRHQYDENCITRYTQTMGGRPRAVQICKCIHRKMRTCEMGGWNMQEAMATATCFSAYNGCQVVDQPTPPPAPNPNYPPPVSGDPLEIPTIICTNKTADRRRALCQSQGVCCDAPPQQPYDPVETTTPIICSSKTPTERARICQSRGLCCPEETPGYDRPVSR